MLSEVRTALNLLTAPISTSVWIARFWRGSTEVCMHFYGCSWFVETVPVLCGSCACLYGKRQTSANDRQCLFVWKSFVIVLRSEYVCVILTVFAWQLCGVHVDCMRFVRLIFHVTSIQWLAQFQKSVSYFNPSTSVDSGGFTQKGTCSNSIQMIITFRISWVRNIINNFLTIHCDFSSTLYYIKPLLPIKNLHAKYQTLFIWY